MMRKSVYRWASAGSAMAMALAASYAHAQDTATATHLQESAGVEEPVAGEIIVTAQKRQQALNDVPMSINAISGDALVDRGVTDVQDLAKLTPGLSYVDSGASTPVFSLRGVGFFDTALAARPSVSVYVDQAPLPFSAMTTGAAFDLERVEVLKGPQGTLFGQNATGGAINYIAAKPEDSFGAGGTISYARFATADFSGYVTGPITPNLDVRIAGRAMVGGNWQRSYTRDAGHGEKFLLQGRFLADWTPSDRVKLALNVNGFRDQGDTQAAQYIAAVPLSAARAPANIPLLLAYPTAPANNRAADWDPDAQFRKNNGFWQASLRGDVELSDLLTLTSLTSYQKMRLRQLNDQDGTALFNTRTTQDGTVKSFYQELRLALDTNGLHGIVGGSYERDRAVENNVFDFPYNTAAYALGAFGLFPGVRQISNQTFKTYGVFGNVDYDISDTITVHGGARYTKADLTYAGCSADIDGKDLAGITGLFNLFRSRVGKGPLAPLAPNSCISFNADYEPVLVAGSLNEDNISWRAGLDFKPSSNFMLYGNVSRGYKAGSLPVVAAVFADQLRPVTQESILAYEVGTKFSMLDRKVEVSAAAFLYDYSDKQLKGRIVTNPNLFGPQEALTNVPKSKIKGVEAQITARPVHGLTLTAGGTYIDSKVTAPFANYTILGTLSQFEGQSFPYTPRWQLVFDGEYRTPLSPRLDGVIGTNVSYRSATKAGFGTEAVLDIDAYTIVDARIGVAEPDGRWSVTLFGRNLTNAYYWSNVAKIGDVARRLTGEPLTYGIQFSAKM